MKKILFAMLGILMFSCNKDEVLDTPDQNINNGRSLYAQKHTPKTKAVELKDRRWEVGSNIKIKFLNGTKARKDSVKSYSKVWMKYANINFVFLDDDSSDAADIRIGFAYKGDKKTWSYVGTDANNVPALHPTMNFGNLSTTLATKGKHEVRMQFGHVLGLVNEHQGPNSTIVLNENVIYDYYLEEKEDENWTIKDVTDFFFMPYKSSQTNSTEYDPKSIMVWPLDQDLILSGPVPTRNSELSEIDIKVIGEMYPSSKLEAKLIDGPSGYYVHAEELNNNLYLSNAYSPILSRVISMDAKQNFTTELDATYKHFTSLYLQNGTVNFNGWVAGGRDFQAYSKNNGVFSEISVNLATDISVKAVVKSVNSGSSYLSSNNGIFQYKDGSINEIPYHTDIKGRTYRLNCFNRAVERNNKIYFAGYFTSDSIGSSHTYSQGTQLICLDKSNNTVTDIPNIVSGVYFSYLDGKLIICGTRGIAYINEDNSMEKIGDIKFGKNIYTPTNNAYKHITTKDNKDYFFAKDEKLLLYNKAEVKMDEIDLGFMPQNIFYAKGKLIISGVNQNVYYLDSNNKPQLIIENEGVNNVIDMTNGKSYIYGSKLWELK